MLTTELMFRQFVLSLRLISILASRNMSIRYLLILELLKLLKNVSQGEFEFYTSNRWFNYWPVNQRSDKRLPRLIRIKFKINEEPYEFVVNPTINYGYVEE